MDPTSAPVAERHTQSEEQRLADLELFVRGVVHDLNNALNVMKTNLYLLRQRLPADETKIQRPLTRIEDQVGTIRNMLEGYQALYHADQPSRQRVNLSELVEKLLQTVGIPEGYQLHQELADSLPLVDADPKLIEASVRAILRNSIRAMPGTGDIRLITRAAGDGVELVVLDSGPGIPAEIQDRVFQPFVSTWPEHAGLGLTLVERVAASHGGMVSVTSTPGEGARVTIQLPAVQR
jgi:signal transduction histidine kinase